MVARKRFGSGGPLVSVIGQGTWPLPDRDALRHGIALGLTHIDTAEMYGDGRSEEIVGEAIAGVPRADLFLVSKVLPQNADAKGVIRACERSLRRMRTDYLDCYLLHWRGSVPIEETMAALERLVESGKIRSLGVSNLDPWDLREAAAALRSNAIACDQVLYNLEERTIEDHELPWARENGAAIVAYTPLGKPTLDAKKKRYAAVAQIAATRGVSAQAVALAFLIRDERVFAIPKASRIEHVAANAAAAALTLDEDEIAAIDAAHPKRRRVGALPTN
ncbi:MAG TPA: aldo/keto reductase [Candidatus Eremiobacteraceae bacterium]|nr:aldo/keto reductase [Candidatus Eremiobacteraceae bacterium]